MTTLGRGKHQGVWRGTKVPIGAIEFETSCATANKTKVADDFVCANALENERSTWIGAVRQTPVRRRDVEPLRGEASPNYHLRRTALAPPESAIFASETVIILTRLRRPGANAAFVTPHLDKPRHYWVVRNSPVPAVRAHVHQPATLLQISHQGVPHLQ